MQGGRLALLAVVGATAWAGCGGNGAEDTNHYVDAVNAAQVRLTGTLERLSGRITSTSSDGADRRTLRAFDTAVSRAVGDLRRVDPPGDVAPMHHRLVRELDGYGRTVRRETTLLRSNDPRRLVAAQQDLLSATNQVSRRINTTIAQINRALRD